jgi:TolB-like protein/tRNA A-37 threonylcarbamoyl transferase component Bud32
MTRFGPYVVAGTIGSGGMGVVYRARDERLQRDVAIKVIRPPWSTDAMRRRRFEIEARAAARIAHPNVVAIYDVGEIDDTPYLVTELLEGGTLGDRISRGSIPAAEALPITIAIAEALAEAHRQGIVHRDLKPENVLFTRSGIPKISDFGLSKSFEPERAASDVATDLALTTEGAIVGTPIYMSPEQAAGREIDFRSDQFAFGSLLVEMLTGERVFQRSTAAHTLSAIIDCDVNLGRLRGVPGGLIAVLRRCLAKNPRDRYASTDDLVHDLKAAAGSKTRTRPRWSGAAAIVAAAAIVIIAVAVFMSKRSALPPHKIESIAILPLANYSGDHAQDYFAEAMTEELTSQLAAVRSLRVASRTSAGAYRGTTKPISTIARELGVDGVIEGSVLRSGSAARVTVQLIDGATDRHLWAATIDHGGNDLMSLQRDVAREIADRISATLSPHDREELQRQPTHSVAAYDAYLHAQYKLNTAVGKREDADDAVRYAEEATRLDPNFAEAWVTIANASEAQMFSWGCGKECDERGYIAVQKALALNPSLASAYQARGQLKYNSLHNFDIAAAIGDYRKAIEINPNLAAAHHALGAELTHLGLHDEAIREFRTTLRLDPTHEGAKFRMARALWQSNRFAAALEVYERYAIVLPERAVPLVFLGRRDDARRLCANREDADAAAVRALIDAVEGNAAAAETEMHRAFDAGGKAPHFHHAAVLLAAADAEMGKAAEAVHWLEVAANHGMPNYPLFRDNPSLRKLRGNAAYESFMADLRLRWDQIVATSSR